MLMMLAVIVAGNAQAVTIASYQSGVAPTAGEAGAADPTTQGWTFNNLGVTNEFADAYDSGDGGWRTVDGTRSAPAFEDATISAAQVSSLVTDGWRLDWTFAMDSDAVGSGGGFVDDYYVSRTDDNVALWLETSAFFYQLRFIVSTGTTNDLFVQNDDLTPVQLTNDGSGFDTFHSLSLISTDGGATADLYLDGSLATTLGSIGTSGTNRVVFGTSSSSGQGSAIWNELELNTLPEPATAGLVGMGAIVLMARRRRRGGK